MLTAHRVHERGLRVGHQHEHIRVQTELVDPAVQLRGDVSARTERKHQKNTHYSCHSYFYSARMHLIDQKVTVKTIIMFQKLGQIEAKSPFP